MKLEKHEKIILAALAGLGILIYVIYLLFFAAAVKNEDKLHVPTPNEDSTNKTELLNNYIEMFNKAKNDVTNASYPLMIKENYQAKYYFDNNEVMVAKYNNLQKITSPNFIGYIIDDNLQTNQIDILFYNPSESKWISSKFSNYQKGYEYMVINEVINKFISMNSTSRTSGTMTMPLRRFYAFLKNVINVNIENPVYNESEVLTFKTVYKDQKLLSLDIIFPRAIVISENNDSVTVIKANFTYQNQDVVITYNGSGDIKVD